MPKAHRTQCLGLRLNTQYLTPFVSSVDADEKLLGPNLAGQLRQRFNNRSIHQVVPELLEDGWVMAPVTIHDYVFLTKAPIEGD